MLKKPSDSVLSALSVAAYGYEYADDGVVKAAQSSPTWHYEYGYRDSWGVWHAGTGDKVGKNPQSCAGSKYQVSSPDGDELDCWIWDDCVE